MCDRYPRRQNTGRLIEYDAVPTDDIQMEQVGFYEVWMEFLRLYVMPLQQKVFNGHTKDVSTRGTLK